jgi:E1A/CREB-binding protein
MKGLLKHGSQCQVKATGGCHVCKRIWALSAVARSSMQGHIVSCAELYGYSRNVSDNSRSNNKQWMIAVAKK